MLRFHCACVSNCFQWCFVELNQYERKSILMPKVGVSLQYTLDCPKRGTFAWVRNSPKGSTECYMWNLPRGNTGRSSSLHLPPHRPNMDVFNRGCCSFLQPNPFTSHSAVITSLQRLCRSPAAWIASTCVQTLRSIGFDLISIQSSDACRANLMSAPPESHLPWDSMHQKMAVAIKTP